MSESWEDILFPPGNEDALFELFHENSKIGRHHQNLSNEEVRARMADLHESLPFEGYPIIEMPTKPPMLSVSLGSAILSRLSLREMVPSQLTFDHLVGILYYAYGVNRDNNGTSLPRPFRMVPSGGTLYPLEIFFHSTCVEGLQPGLYHYNPSKNHLRYLLPGNHTETITNSMVQSDIGKSASLIVFITAVFERSIFKYGDRGYRFIFLEAGHVAQNINLVSNALGLGCVNIGGFFDREIDEFLDLDGVTHSTIYMVPIGNKK